MFKKQKYLRRDDVMVFFLLKVSWNGLNSLKCYFHFQRRFVHEVRVLSRTGWYIISTGTAVSGVDVKNCLLS